MYSIFLYIYSSRTICTVYSDIFTLLGQYVQYISTLCLPNNGSSDGLCLPEE